MKRYYPSQDPLIKLKQEMRLRGFSQRTIKSYVYYVGQFLQFSGKSPKTVNTQDIYGFLERLVLQKRSSSTLNLAYSALQFYFGKILWRKFFLKIPRAKQSKKLPVVLSKAELSEILSLVKNIKHQLLLAMAYGGGLRVSEVINLKVADIDLEQNTIHVRQSKGGRDRMTLLSNKILVDLREFIAGKKRG